jgi:membrane protein insertase Oxa1/YidC/SpoIIIJ
MSMSTQMLVGCLPILLTMPFLIAFYRVLAVSIELRGAPFLWIPDLSHKDPLYLTPVLMGLSMFAMQKMTPSTMDPAQQRMMTIMPIVFSVMFALFPAGLVLYWVTNTGLAILQQWNTRHPGPDRPARKGQGRTGFSAGHRGRAGGRRRRPGAAVAPAFVVLDPGLPGAWGLGHAARIAVILDARAPARRRRTTVRGEEADPWPADRESWAP